MASNSSAKVARDQADDQMIHEAIIVHHDFRDLSLTRSQSKYTEWRPILVFLISRSVTKSFNCKLRFAMVAIVNGHTERAKWRLQAKEHAKWNAVVFNAIIKSIQHCESNPLLHSTGWNKSNEALLLFRPVLVQLMMLFLSVNFVFYYCFFLTQKIGFCEMTYLCCCSFCTEKHLDENAAGYDFLVDFHHSEGTKSSHVDDLTTIVQVVAYCVRNVLTFPRTIVVLREEKEEVVMSFWSLGTFNVIQTKLLTFGRSSLVLLIERLVRFMISWKIFMSDLIHQPWWPHLPWTVPDQEAFWSA